MGELLDDQEHGRGVLSDQNGTRIVGIWRHGRLDEELVEMVVPASEVDPQGPQAEQRVFISSRKPDAPMERLADMAEGSGDSKSIVLFTNGDKYVGALQDGKKHGQGMYVYADGSAFKGRWAENALDGELHPGNDTSDQTQRLHGMNVRNATAVATMKAAMPGERKQTALVTQLQD